MSRKIPISSNIEGIYNLLKEAEELASVHDPGYQARLDEAVRISDFLNAPIGGNILSKIRKKYNESEPDYTT